MKSRSMKVSVLVLEGCTPIAPIGAMELLRKCGELHQQRTGASRSFFDVELVSRREGPVPVTKGAGITCHRSMNRLRKTDLLIIPAIEFDIEAKLHDNRSLLDPIRRLHGRGAEVASLCTGAFLLAATGLLDGKDATTHWAMAGVFRQMFPRVRLRDERILVDNGGLYTAGGATSFMNLMVYLVEKFCGKDTAVAACKLLLIDYRKSPQQAYAIFSPQLGHGDEVIRGVQDYVHTHPGRAHGVSELARRAKLSLRSFIRRWKAATGETPTSYLQRVRVEHAKHLLESTTLNVDEVARRLGYSDVPSFRQVFTRHTGLVPRSYRNRYRIVG